MIVRIIWILIFFTIWGIADYFSFYFIFDRIINLQKRPDYHFNYFWAVVYFAINYAYCLTKFLGMMAVANILYFLFYFKAVPLLWHRYGIKGRIPAIVFFFEEEEAVISSTLAIIAVYACGAPVADHLWINDCLTAVTAVIFSLGLGVIIYFRKAHISDIGFADLPLWKYIILIAAVYFSGSLESSIWYGNGNIKSRICSIAALLLVLIMTGMVIFVNSRNYTMEGLLSVLDSQVSQLAAQYRRQNSSDIEMRKLSHDVRNHLTAIRAMLEKNDYDGLKKYIDSLEPVQSESMVTFNTGNPMADAVLSSKASAADRAEAVIVFDGVVPDRNIADSDLVILLSNLVDNAIEACEKITGSKQIRISSTFQNGMWVFRISNPVEHLVTIVNNRIATTKSDREIHGIGISNVERIAEKYDGCLFLSCDEQTFTAKTVISLN